MKSANETRMVQDVMPSGKQERCQPGGGLTGASRAGTYLRLPSSVSSRPGRHPGAGHSRGGRGAVSMGVHRGTRPHADLVRSAGERAGVELARDRPRTRRAGPHGHLHTGRRADGAGDAAVLTASSGCPGAGHRPRPAHPPVPSRRRQPAASHRRTVSVRAGTPVAIRHLSARSRAQQPHRFGAATRHGADRPHPLRGRGATAHHLAASVERRLELRGHR